MSKTSTLRRRLSGHPVLARAAAGVLPALWEMERSAREAERGALGETALHWAMRDGRADWAVAWALAGGPTLPDERGSTALHWMASAVHGAGAGAMWRHPGFATAYGRHALALDGQGRDVAGLSCLGRDGGGLEALAQSVPSALSGGVHLGIGSPLGLADAMLACQMIFGMGASGNEGGPVLSKLLGRLDPPSRRMPRALGIPGGLWSQPLWTAAVASMATLGQLARMEAREIAARVSLADERPAKPTRI